MIDLRSKIAPKQRHGKNNSERVSADTISASTQTPTSEVSTEVNELRSMGAEALRVRWARRFRSTAPPIQSADVLMRLYAHKVQVETYGELDNETTKLLARARAAVARGKSPLPRTATQLRTGTVLVREWRGVTHRVLVLDRGFQHDNRRYQTLTEVARAITGTHWSGPRFFGLEEKSPHKYELPMTGETP